MSAHFDPQGRFGGHEPRRCGEHRTVGPHRAWCFDCGEWCYPAQGCERCHNPLLEAAELVDNLGSAVRTQRLRLGLTIRDVSRASGVSPATLSLTERCGNQPTAPNVAALLRWLATVDSGRRNE